MNRRTFAGLSLAAVGGIFVPEFGRWYRRGSGVVVRDVEPAGYADFVSYRFVSYQITGAGVKIISEDRAPLINGTATIPNAAPCVGGYHLMAWPIP